jgi:hypothetical protein
MSLHRLRPTRPLAHLVQHQYMRLSLDPAPRTRAQPAHCQKTKRKRDMKPKILLSVIVGILALAAFAFLAVDNNLGGWFSTPTPMPTATHTSTSTSTPDTGTLDTPTRTLTPTATSTFPQTPTPTSTATKTPVPYIPPTDTKQVNEPTLPPPDPPTRTPRPTPIYETQP